MFKSVHTDRISQAIVDQIKDAPIPEEIEGGRQIAFRTAAHGAI
jgi:hypothetical protein